MKQYILLLTSLLILILAGCKAKELPPEPDNTITPTPIDTSNALQHFTSTISGDYRLFSNTAIANLVSAYPLTAAFPEMLKLEKKAELDEFTQKSQADGFDKEQFNLLYDATFEVINTLTTHYANDIFNGLIGSLHSNPQIDFQTTIEAGKKGKGKTFTYASDHTFRLAGCTSGPEYCDIVINVDVTFEHPTNNPTFTLGPQILQMDLKDLHIHFKTFSISNSVAQLNLALNKTDTFIINSAHLWGEDNSGSIIYQDLWSITDSPSHTSSNLIAEFTNTYFDNDGKAQEIKITGSAIGVIESFNFYNHFDTSPEPTNKPKFDWLTTFEAEQQLETTLQLDSNTITGFAQGANLKLNFVTKDGNH